MAASATAMATATFIIAVDGITTTNRTTSPIGAGLTAMHIRTSLGKRHMPCRTITDTGASTIIIAPPGAVFGRAGDTRAHMSGRTASTLVTPHTLLASI